MEEGPEYAVDEKQRIHRIASGIVFACWVLLALHAHGLAQAFRTAVYYMLPLSCIWFPDAMASYSGVVLGRGRYIDTPSHPVFLRWAGWFLLLIVPLFLLLLFALNK